MSTFGIPDDLGRLRRFFIFGFFDGAVGKSTSLSICLYIITYELTSNGFMHDVHCISTGHTWFQLLDKFLMVNKPEGAWSTIMEKVAWDILVYTPAWCVFFLVSMCLLRGDFRLGEHNNKIYHPMHHKFTIIFVCYRKHNSIN